MRKIHLYTILFFLFLALIFLTLRDGTSSPTPQKPGSIIEPINTSVSPFAVVELFTSEGCSSCPPADKLLSEIVADARKNRKQVFPLSFHVDYWNRLGWKDPFSDAVYSERQRRYAYAFNLNHSYTPQMIVNGTEEFVGSDRSKAAKYIENALNQPAQAAVKMQAETQNEKSTITVKYEIIGVTKEKILNIALVERNLVNKIPRGENTGRTLRHDNVVRVFRTIRLSANGKGKFELKLPDSVKQKNSSIIGYIQNPETMVVSGAGIVSY